VTKHVRRQGYRAGSRHADRLQNRFHTLPCGRGHSIASPPRDRRVAPSCLCCTTGRWLKDAAPLSTAAAEWRWWWTGGGTKRKGKPRRACLPPPPSGFYPRRAPLLIITMATPTPPAQPPPILCSSPLPLRPRLGLPALLALFVWPPALPPASFFALFNSSPVPSSFSGLPRRTGNNSPFTLPCPFDSFSTAPLGELAASGPACA
jgi:hypothetical protein